MDQQLASIVILALVIIAFISVFISIYNTMVMLKINAEQSYDNIDVLLKQRADEVPNLISAVKEHMGCENEILTRLTYFRTQYLNATTQNKKIDINNRITKNFNSFMAVAENYPDLKASRSFAALQGRLTQLEDNIADKIEFFNESANLYNTAIHKFPHLILADVLNYRDKSLLKITEVEKAHDGVKV